MKEIMAKGPWNIENQLLVMARQEDGSWPTENMFNRGWFWVQLRGIPAVMCTEKMGAKICSALYPVSMIQLREEPSTGERWFRLRMVVDVTKPFRRLVRLYEEGHGEVRCVFRYERLPVLCFDCGRVGHARKDCAQGVEQEDGLGFGPWMSTAMVGGRILWTFAGGEETNSDRQITEGNMRMEIEGPSSHGNKGRRERRSEDTDDEDIAGENGMQVGEGEDSKSKANDGSLEVVRGKSPQVRYQREMEVGSQIQRLQLDLGAGNDGIAGKGVQKSGNPAGKEAVDDVGGGQHDKKGQQDKGPSKSQKVKPFVLKKMGQ